jgi:hypothetical protein
VNLAADQRPAVQRAPVPAHRPTPRDIMAAVRPGRAVGEQAAVDAAAQLEQGDVGRRAGPGGRLGRRGWRFGLEAVGRCRVVPRCTAVLPIVFSINAL